MTTLQRAFKSKTVGAATVAWFLASIMFWLFGISVHFLTCPQNVYTALVVYAALTACHTAFHMSRYYKCKRLLDDICTAENDYLFYNVNNVSGFGTGLCFDSGNIYLLKQSAFQIIPFDAIISADVRNVMDHKYGGVRCKALDIKYRSKNARIHRKSVELTKQQVEEPNFALLMKRIGGNI